MGQADPGERPAISILSGLGSAPFGRFNGNCGSPCSGRQRPSQEERLGRIAMNLSPILNDGQRQHLEQTWGARLPALWPFVISAQIFGVKLSNIQKMGPTRLPSCSEQQDPAAGSWDCPARL